MSTTIDGPLLESTVRDAVAGDEAAFTLLVAAYHGDMFRISYVVCGDADAAQEAVQSAWAIAWRKLERVRNPDRVRSWLIAVAANEARQVARRTRRRAIREITVDPNVEFEGTAPILGVDPSDRLDLATVLARLNAEDRSMIAMRYALGMSSTEIGAATGLSAPTVRMRLSRLLGRLRTELVDG